MSDGKSAPTGEGAGEGTDGAFSKDTGDSMRTLAPATTPLPSCIVGVGTDLCDIRRIEATLDRKGERFAQKVLGPTEWQVYQQRKARIAVRGLRYLATRFAAKEAFSKAIGLGMRWPMTWRHCEILNAPSGRPEVRLHGELATWFEARQWRAHVTVTDEVDHALAFVVVEQLPMPPTARTGA